MKGALRDLSRGTGLALLAGAGCFLLARFAFGRLYYLGVLLPAAMMTMLLVAWLIHLKADGFFGGAKKEPSPAQEPAPAKAGEDRLYASFKDGILERPSPGGGHASILDSRDVMRALLWGAAELCLLSIALYHLAGIGSEFLR